MRLSLPVSDRISLIPFIQISTRWHTLEGFTKLFSDTTANSPSAFLLPCSTASLTMWLWFLQSLIAVVTQVG